ERQQRGGGLRRSFARWTRVVAAFAAAVAALASSAAGSGAAVIDSASVVQRGAIVELHFGMHGKGLGWALSEHSGELWIDLANTRIELPPRPLYGRESAPVVAVRAIDAGGTRSRLVIRVAGKTDYAVGKLPHELVIRLAPAGQAPNLAAPVLTHLERRGERAAAGRPLAPAPPAAAVAVAPPIAVRRPATPVSPVSPPPSPAAVAAGDGDGAAEMAAMRPPAPSGRADASPRGGGAAAIPAPPQRQPVAVIDPGHGGYDSGTEAAAPLLEKDLALQIALRLQGELERRGVHAILTRTGDYFVTLADRTAFANKADADLFISIHLNSSPD